MQATWASDPKLPSFQKIHYIHISQGNTIYGCIYGWKLCGEAWTDVSTYSIRRAQRPFTEAATSGNEEVTSFFHWFQQCALEHFSLHHCLIWIFFHAAASLIVVGFESFIDIWIFCRIWKFFLWDFKVFFCGIWKWQNCISPALFSNFVFFLVGFQSFLWDLKVAKLRLSCFIF